MKTDDTGDKEIFDSRYCIEEGLLIYFVNGL